MKSKQPPSPQEKSLVKIVEPSTDDDDEDDEELDLDDSDDDGGQVVNLQSRENAPIGGGLVNKNVASTGPQQIHIGTLVGRNSFEEATHTSDGEQESQKRTEGWNTCER